MEAEKHRQSDQQEREKIHSGSHPATARKRPIRADAEPTPAEGKESNRSHKSKIAGLATRQIAADFVHAFNTRFIGLRPSMDLLTIV